MRRVVLASFLAICVVGCKQVQLMPLTVGSAWTYNVVTPYLNTIESASIQDGDPVGSVDGYLLKGPNQSARLGWDGSTLMLSGSGSTYFHPPIPLIIGNREKGRWQWKGQVIVAGDPEPSEATVIQEPSEATASGRKFKTIRTVLTFIYKNQTVTLATEWANEVGIVKQEQRRDDKLVVRIEWINGPRKQS